MTTNTPSPGNAAGLPADPPQDQLVDLGNSIEGLLAAVELCSDAMIGVTDPKLAEKALPTLVDILTQRTRDLVLGIDTLKPEGLRHG